jgi:hypothetical protein
MTFKTKLRLINKVRNYKFDPNEIHQHIKKIIQGKQNINSKIVKLSCVSISTSLRIEKMRQRDFF